MSNAKKRETETEIRTETETDKPTDSYFALQIPSDHLNLALMKSFQQKKKTLI